MRLQWLSATQIPITQPYILQLIGANYFIYAKTEYTINVLPLGVTTHFLINILVLKNEHT